MASGPSVPSVPKVPAVPPAPEELTSGDFPVLWPVGTRWADNDMFGHLNNAVYYEIFDTAINAWINTTIGLDPMTAASLVVVAESGCRYLSELHFPDGLAVGIAVTRLGRSSVTYRLGVFRAGHRQADRGDGGAGGSPARGEPIAALGHWVDVYVDRASRKPVPIPDAISSLLSTVRVDQ